jgi:capsular polysaccharide transport system ATP-binding protein
MIKLIDIHKAYKTDHGRGDYVLNGVNLTIPSNVSVGLIGANGAGKSTLLRIIAGTDTPTKGRVIKTCNTSWPMGGGGFHGSLTGRQNAKFVCRIYGFEDSMDERIAFIQDFAEIGEAFDRQVNTYSSGMKSRLQFGMSLAFDFDVYISDEVTSAGDAKFAKKAKEAFKALKNKASMIMVSHSEGTLKDFCEAGIYVKNGVALWFDKLDDALTAYQNN